MLLCGTLMFQVAMLCFCIEAQSQSLAGFEAVLIAAGCKLLQADLEEEWSEADRATAQIYAKRNKQFYAILESPTNGLQVATDSMASSLSSRTGM
jgi:hypothetical protein